MPRNLSGRKRFFLIFFCAVVCCSPGLFAGPPLGAVSVSNPRLRVLAAAEAYLGTPYKYAGTDKRGLDCSGLVYLSFRDALGVNVPRTAESLFAWSERISGGENQAGDLLFFTTAGTGAVSHVGIYAGNGRFIHAASSGPRTGVIFSYMDEDYWRRNYAGARRVLPVDAGLPFPDGGTGPVAAAGGGMAGGRDLPGSLLLELGMAPSWGVIPGQGSPVRGAEFQFRFAWDIPLGTFRLSPGVEFRPEWDSLLGVFRFPLTVSLGWGDRVRVFLGPALTLGDPVMADSGGGRRYTGGNNWLGTVGMSVAPFTIKAGNGILSPYAELAWRSFSRDPAFNADIKADLGAALKFSTGIRYTWEL
jgi:probable lipoprotein NlpC